MSTLLGWIKFIMEGTAKDLRWILLTLLLSGAAFGGSVVYVEKKHKQLKAESKEKQNEIKNVLKAQQAILVAHLKDMKDDTRDLKKELREDIRRTQRQVWELSQSIKK